ncbi:hypothetical protein [Streptomyces sp. A012304]|uniref:SCO2400 family protein n=1 Tax=Streptomyces sp. A012304 TaxID=375446 RepID=UPI00222E0E4C|nr:hypothetical protein [Streptomyces sp. A012304]GKQ38938.1 hypothetical protein ALMP_54670 [Streptomyces sp. A012304]
MDYCSTCRRHLNGALVCPGCGAYAPDIAPRVVSSDTAAEPVTPEVTWQEEPPAAGPSVEPAGVAPAPMGRAARRRRLARMKKTQRRALVATAVAFVGGGLTVASSQLDRPTDHRTQATTAPDTAGMGAAEEPASEYETPTSDGADVARSTPGRTGRSTVAGDPRRTPVTPSNTRPDAATAPGTAAPAAQRPRTTPATSGYAEQAPAQVPVGSDTGAVAAQPATPPAADDGTASDASNSSGGSDTSGTSQSSPAPSATSPSDTSAATQEKLCVLVICLG